MLATPKPDQLLLTGSTPGVIGAQEVYRDPRLRRLAEQQQQKAQRQQQEAQRQQQEARMKVRGTPEGFLVVTICLV